MEAMSYIILSVSSHLPSIIFCVPSSGSYDREWNRKQLPSGIVRAKIRGFS